MVRAFARGVMGRRIDGVDPLSYCRNEILDSFILIF